MANPSLKVTLEVDDKGSVVVKQFGKTVDSVNLKNFGDKMGSVAKGAGSLAKSFAAVAAGAAAMGGALVAAVGAFSLKAAVEEFADFEQAWVKLGNVTGENLDEIKTKIMELPSELGSATELMSGYYQVLSAGITGTKESMDMLTVASKTAQEAGIAQGEVVRGLSSFMDAFKESAKESSETSYKLVESYEDGVVSFKKVATEMETVAGKTMDAARAADLLYTIEKEGKTTISDLIPYIGNLSNAAAAVGMSSNEMAAALAEVTQSGAGTAESVTALRSLITSLSKKFDDMPESVRKYGSAAEAVKNLGFDGVLKKIWEHTKGNSSELIDLLGRQEAYLALLQLSKGEFTQYGKKLSEMTESTGAFDDAWKRYSGTLRAVWDTFKNTVGNQIILLVEYLAPTLKEVIESAGAWLEQNRELIQVNLGGWIKNVVETGKDLIESLIGIKEKTDDATEKVGGFIGALEKIGLTIGFVAKVVDKGIKMIGSFMDAIDDVNKKKVKVEFEGEGSLTRPLSEKIDEMTKLVQDFSGIVQEPMITDIDLSAVTSGIEQASNHYASFSGQIDEGLLPLLDNTTVGESIDEMSDVFGAAKDLMEEPIVPEFNFNPAQAALEAYAATMQDQISAAMLWAATASNEMYRNQAKKTVNRLQSEYNKTAAYLGNVYGAENSFRGYASGTGVAGVPSDGLAYVHKGEIIKSPAESEIERRGRGEKTVNVYLSPQLMVADEAGTRKAIGWIKQGLKEYDRRVGDA